MPTLLPAVLTLEVATPRARVLRVVDVALACCALEVSAAAAIGLPAPGTETERSVDAHVLVVSGTVTDVLAGTVRALYDALPEPRFVVSFGACATSGGPYWDSYAVLKGVDQIVPVDLWVPGCPPRPEALLEALGRLPEEPA